jgi:hypothetical protein
MKEVVGVLAVRRILAPNSVFEHVLNVLFLGTAFSRLPYELEYGKTMKQYFRTSALVQVRSVG